MVVSDWCMIMSGMAPVDPVSPILQAVLEALPAAMDVEQPDLMEIDGEEDDNFPTPIAVWSELCEQDGSVGLDADLMHKIRNCKVPDDHGDVSRRIPGTYTHVFGL